VSKWHFISKVLGRPPSFFVLFGRMHEKASFTNWKPSDAKGAKVQDRYTAFSFPNACCCVTLIYKLCISNHFKCCDLEAILKNCVNLIMITRECLDSQLPTEMCSEFTIEPIKASFDSFSFLEPGSCRREQEVQFSQRLRRLWNCPSKQGLQNCENGRKQWGESVECHWLRPVNYSGRDTTGGWGAVQR
jgi:hypothetical protein